MIKDIKGGSPKLAIREDGRMNMDSLLEQHHSLLTGRWLTDLANTSAFIFSELPQLNWAGFYLLEGTVLTLGPFQGRPACTDIVIGRGVCGTAAARRQTIIVPDVHQFPGHIACDAASRSEIVVPMIRDHNLLGVLDVDSPVLDRFGSEEQIFFEKLISQFLERSKL